MGDVLIGEITKRLVLIRKFAYIARNCSAVNK